LCQDKKGGRVWGNAPMAIENYQDEAVKAKGFKGNTREPQRQ